MVRRVLFVLIACLLVACGDDDTGEESTRSTTTEATSTSASETSELEQWRAEATAICEEYQPQIEQIESDLGVPEDADGFASFIDAVLPVLEPYVDEFVAVEVPEEQAQEVQRLYELRESSKDLAISVRDAGVSGDSAAVQEGVAEIIRQGNELAALVEQLDVSACV